MKLLLSIKKAKSDFFALTLTMRLDYAIIE